MLEEHEAKVRLTRNVLNEAVRRANRASWDNFVEKWGSDPWEFVRQPRSQQSQPVPAIASNGQDCLTVVDSMTTLVSEFVLADNRREKNDWHSQVRQDNDSYNCGEGDDSFEDEDIEATLCSMRKGKERALERSYPKRETETLRTHGLTGRSAYFPSWANSWRGS